MIESLSKDFLLTLEKSKFCNELRMCSADLIENLIEALYWRKCELENIKKVETYGTPYYDHYCLYKNKLSSSCIYVLDFLYKNNYGSTDYTAQYNFAKRPYLPSYIFDIYLVERLDQLENNMTFWSNLKSYTIGVESCDQCVFKDFDFTHNFNQFEIRYVLDENKYAIFLYAS